MNDIPSANDGLSEPIDLELGTRLRERRVAARLSQIELGVKLRLSAHQIQRYETGADRLSAATLLKAAAALDIPPAALLPDDVTREDKQPFQVVGGEHLEKFFEAFRQIQTEDLKHLLVSVAACLADMEVTKSVSS